MKKRFRLLLSVFLLGTVCMLNTSIAQDDDDLLGLIEDDKPVKEEVTATFKATRIINGHSIERAREGQLHFRISHRFMTWSVYEDFEDAARSWFGLDGANVQFNFEYGLNDRIMIGLTRTSVQKTYTGFTKISLLRQTQGGSDNVPISLSAFVSAEAIGEEWADPNRENYFSSRMSYVYQILAARKFNERLSLQLSPTMVHRNLVATKTDPNDLFALGMGGRFKLNRSVSFNAEYFLVTPPSGDKAFTNMDCFSVGFDIETGGHIFQLHFTNSRFMTEAGFIGKTQGDWLKSDINFGFNIVRPFALK